MLKLAMPPPPLTPLFALFDVKSQFDIVEEELIEFIIPPPPQPLSALFDVKLQLEIVEEL